jgi:hypothetical protein
MILSELFEALTKTAQNKLKTRQNTLYQQINVLAPILKASGQDATPATLADVFKEYNEEEMEYIIDMGINNRKIPANVLGGQTGNSLIHKMAIDLWKTDNKLQSGMSNAIVAKRLGVSDIDVQEAWKMNADLLEDMYRRLNIKANFRPSVWYGINEERPKNEIDKAAQRNMTPEQRIESKIVTIHNRAKEMTNGWDRQHLGTLTGDSIGARINMDGRRVNEIIQAHRNDKRISQLLPYMMVER